MQTNKDYIINLKHWFLRMATHCINHIIIKHILNKIIFRKVIVWYTLQTLFEKLRTSFKKEYHTETIDKIYKYLNSNMNLVMGIL